jgi:HAD superfamily hydrolase (TIGR01490 family)
MGLLSGRAGHRRRRAVRTGQSALLRPIPGRDPREHFLAERIRPIVPAAAERLLEQHRTQGDTLLIITATNRFVTEPIAALLGVPHLIATDPERIGGRFTGEVAGTPSYREGKVERLRDWMERHGQGLAGSWFYSDSHNDLPLLEQVEHPVAVDPDPPLRGTAAARGWPIISLRKGEDRDARP